MQLLFEASRLESFSSPLNSPLITPTIDFSDLGRFGGLLGANMAAGGHGHGHGHHQGNLGFGGSCANTPMLGTPLTDFGETDLLGLASLTSSLVGSPVINTERTIMSQAGAAQHQVHQLSQSMSHAQQYQPQNQYVISTQSYQQQSNRSTVMADHQYTTHRPASASSSIGATTSASYEMDVYGSSSMGTPASRGCTPATMSTGCPTPGMISMTEVKQEHHDEDITLDELIQMTQDPNLLQTPSDFPLSVSGNPQFAVHSLPPPPYGSSSSAVVIPTTITLYTQQPSTSGVARRPTSLKIQNPTPATGEMETDSEGETESEDETDETSLRASSSSSHGAKATAASSSRTAAGKAQAKYSKPGAASHAGGSIKKKLTKKQRLDRLLAEEERLKSENKRISAEIDYSTKAVAHLRDWLKTHMTRGAQAMVQCGWDKEMAPLTQAVIHAVSKRPGNTGC